MKKSRMTIIFVIVLILSNLLFATVGFKIGERLSIESGSKVVVTRENYDKMKAIYDENEKVVMIKDTLDKLYLREIDENELKDGQLKGMVNALGDPYTVYMTKDEYEKFNENTDGVFGGIGIYVSPGKDGFITVVAPIEDTPAFRAGIKTDDKIIKVNGKEYFSETMDEAVKTMRGEPNTDVTITILRRNADDKAETFDVDITREIIRIQSVKSKMVDNEVGYMRVSSFDKLTYQDFETQIKELEAKGAKGLILDLRGNPGGLMDISTKMADYFLGKSTIVYTEDKNGNQQFTYSSAKNDPIPMVVLIDKGSASASEIFSGAIKDNKRATLIGTTSFGKGLVQRLQDLPDGSGLKVTIYEYFTPNGINIHGIGIEPDIVVELNEDVETIGIDNIDKDNQLQKALEVIKTKID